MPEDDKPLQDYSTAKKIKPVTLEDINTNLGEAIYLLGLILMELKQS